MMRDYESALKQARTCANRKYCDIGGNCEYYDLDVCCQGGEKDILNDAADAIEELLARVSENDWRVCKNCSLQHFDTDGMRWCEELSMVVGGNFYCGFFEGSEPPKEVE